MSEKWSTLTADDVVAEMTASEKTALDTLKDGATDLESIVTHVSDQVRDAWRSGGRLLQAKGIPAGMFPRAIAIARWNFIISVPNNDQIQTSAREGANREALDYLKQIARREVPTEGGAQSNPAPVRQATRTKMDGLI